MHTWSQGGGLWNNAHGTLKKKHGNTLWHNLTHLVVESQAKLMDP